MIALLVVGTAAMISGLSVVRIHLEGKTVSQRLIVVGAFSTGLGFFCFALGLSYLLGLHR